jgi:hypothetical protein
MRLVGILDCASLNFSGGEPKAQRRATLQKPELDFAHFWHFGCGAKPLKILVPVGWHKTFLHVQALDLGPSNG